MNKTLKKIIEEYTTGRISGAKLFIRPLSESVHYGLAWPEPGEEVAHSGIVNPRILYFIMQDASPVGAVELLEANLDCFMFPVYRKKGIFSKAMKSVILPHILQQKPLQRLQIGRSEHNERKFEVLKKIFVSLGFVILREDSELRMVIDASRKPVGRFIAGDNKALSAERKDSMRKEFLWIAYRLTLIRSELELQEGISYLSEDIGEIIKRLSAHGL
ncbi:hypothetical protein LL912_12505 [Niabella sp. CC-SYL272]|uniref:hypothetical protein n=1 Tax=Niabella agricola TaxID=2891571 RepID=UPI001F23DD4A|nr:hypothetical protein [Niabella agricola]MCF3109594.1 hypothetical protein [Niabella agricola]